MGYKTWPSSCLPKCIYLFHSSVAHCFIILWLYHIRDLVQDCSGYKTVLHLAISDDWCTYQRFISGALWCQTRMTMTSKKLAMTTITRWTRDQMLAMGHVNPHKLREDVEVPCLMKTLMMTIALTLPPGKSVDEADMFVSGIDLWIWMLMNYFSEWWNSSGNLILYRWLSTRLQSVQCISNGVTAVWH